MKAYDEFGDGFNLTGLIKTVKHLGRSLQGVYWSVLHLCMYAWIAFMFSLGAATLVSMLVGIPALILHAFGINFDLMVSWGAYGN
jgi:hypothetical protein